MRVPGETLLLPQDVWLSFCVGERTICNMNGQVLEPMPAVSAQSPAASVVRRRVLSNVVSVYSAQTGRNLEAATTVRLVVLSERAP